MTARKIAGGGISTILVADVCPMLRAGLIQFMQPSSNIEIIGEACDAETTIELASSLQPDYVILDPQFFSPDSTISYGVDANVCRDLKCLNPSPSVIIYSGCNSVSDMAVLALAGADCFIYKGVNHKKLRELSLRIFVEGQVWEPGTVGEGGNLHLKISRHRSCLTLAERRVFDLVIQRYANSEIACKLHLAPQTVKNHLSSVFRKIGIKSRKELFSLLET